MKPHLAESPDPIMHGTRVTTMCNKVIGKVTVEFVWDASEGFLPSMNSLSCCAKCFRKATEPSKTRHFLYGVSGAIDGESAKHEGAE